MSWSKQTQAASGGGAVTQATEPWVVDGSGVTQPVSGVFYPATQPISVVSLPLPAGAALDSSLATIAADVALQAKLTDTQPVSGAFFPATQPVSAVSLPLPAGAALDSSLATIAADVALQAKLTDTQPVSGTVGVSNFPATQAVTGTFYQAIQPISGTVTLIGEALEALRPPRQKLGRDALHPRRGVLRRKHQYA